MTVELYVGLGLDLATHGALEQAKYYFSRAIELRPDYPEAYNNLGVVLIQRRQLEEAENSLRQAIKLRRDYPEAYNNLGVVLKETNRPDEAKANFGHALELKPNYPEAYVNLGEILMSAKHPAEAERCFRRAIVHNPHCAEAYNSLGFIAVGEKHLDEAANLFRHAIRLKMDYPEACNNLGTVLTALNNLEEAEVCFRRAIQLRSGYPEAHNGLGLVFKKMNRLNQAEECFRRAIELDFEYPQSWVNLAMVFKETHRLDEAEEYLHKVIDSHPDFLEADFALGILYLLRGEYDKWWKKYELRCRVLGYHQPEIRRWQGEDLTGCKILLFHEQGFGDTLQFARYAVEVAKLAAETILWVPQPLERLVSASLSNCTIYVGENIEPEQYDFACPLPSLPFVFQTTQATIPSNVPYLRPSAEIVKKWHEILENPNGAKGYKIGLVWAGNPGHKNDHNRSIPFKLFSDLFEINGVSWISLQAGQRAGDLVTTTKIVDCSGQLTDFAETAGVIANLDLVITVDTAVAHLAGAMGKKAWVLLPFAPDWRWQLEREDSPWYPTIRLFRQRMIGDWQDVLARVKQALRDENK